MGTVFTVDDPFILLNKWRILYTCVARNSLSCSGFFLKMSGLSALAAAAAAAAAATPRNPTSKQIHRSCRVRFPVAPVM